jgi:hypothetical protein
MMTGLGDALICIEKQVFFTFHCIFDKVRQIPYHRARKPGSTGNRFI